MLTSWRSQLCLAVCAWVGACSLAPAQGEPTQLPAEALENVWRLSDRILSGSQPEGHAAFAELARWGVTTIVSVDGTQPHLKQARRFGMRYVHIPIGYAGIEPEPQRMLVRVAREIPGTIYVHCHHGKHRGPAAAAIVCRADDGRSSVAARLILHRAGTGKEYPALWRAVESFENPSASAHLPALVEQAEVESLAAAMAKLDRSFEHLQHSAKKGWLSLSATDGEALRSASVQLRELFAEAARQMSAPGLRSELEHSTALAQELVGALGQTRRDPARLDDLLAKLGANCTSCHKQHRN